jgi:hypothetical protein
MPIELPDLRTYSVTVVVRRFPSSMGIGVGKYAHVCYFGFQNSVFPTSGSELVDHGEIWSPAHGVASVWIKENLPFLAWIPTPTQTADADSSEYKSMPEREAKAPQEYIGLLRRSASGSLILRALGFPHGFVKESNRTYARARP